MVALIRKSNSEIIANWGDSIPSMFRLPDGDEIHCANSTWSNDRYKFIEVIYVDEQPHGYSILTGSTQEILDNKLVVTSLYDDPDIDTFKNNAIKAIDIKAENIRLKYITPGAGQAAVYIMKYNEAIEVLKDSAPDANQYPLTASNIGLPGITNIIEAATSVVDQYTAWISIAAMIEDIRLKAKRSIEASNTIENAFNAFTSIDWRNL
jgi:hypothetical protein